MKIEFFNYMVSTVYRFGNVEKIRLTSEYYSNEFSSGINYLKGDIYCGLTAVSYSTTPGAENTFSDSAEIKLDGEPVNINYIKRITAYLGQPIKSLHSCESLLKKKAKSANLNYKELLEKLNFPEWLLDRRPSQLGHYTMQFLTAYYYLAGKKIFVMPYCSKYTIRPYTLNLLLNFLKDKDIITLIPISEDYDFDIKNRGFK